MNKEKQNEGNINTAKEQEIEKTKNNTTFTPINENAQNDLRQNQNLLNLQNSACKNLKNDVKSESANLYM